MRDNGYADAAKSWRQRYNAGTAALTEATDVLSATVAGLYEHSWDADKRIAQARADLKDVSDRLDTLDALIREVA